MAMHPIRLVAGLLLAAPIFAVDDWPQWLGPARDGVSQEREWSSTGAAEPLWRRDVGRGYSCVTVVDGALYTSGHDVEALEDRVLCLDAATGEERWRHAFPAETMDRFHGGGTQATPIWHEGRLYVSHREGRTFALDAATGELVWERDLGTSHEIEPTMYGFAASPLVLADGLYIHVGDRAFRLDPDTGEVVWHADELGAGGYANPLPFEHHGHPSLLLYTGDGVVVLDRETGAATARVEAKGGSVRGGLKASTPLVLGERVLVSAAYDQGSTLIDFSGEEPTKVWESRRMRAKVSGIFRWEDHVYGFDESMLKCIDLDGNEVWRVRGLGMGALSIAGGRLLVLSSESELIVAEATPEEFRELSRAHVLTSGGECWTTPVIVDGLVYCRSSLGELVCRDHRGTPAQVAPGESDANLPFPRTGLAPPAASLLAGQSFLREDAAAVTSFRATGTFESTAQGITPMPMTLEIAADGRWALVVDMGEFGEIRRGCDGEAAWSLDPFYSDEVFAGVLLDEARELWSLDGRVGWRGDGELRGRASFLGYDAWAVDVPREDEPPRTVWFDVDSHRLIGQEAPGASLIRFGEWRVIDGVPLPTDVRILEPEAGIEDRLRIESGERNVVDLETAFARPSEVVAMLRTPEEIEAENARLAELHAAKLGTYVVGFEPFVGQDAVVEVAEGELRFTLAGVPPFALEPPDEDGVLAVRGRPGLTLRFEATESGPAGAVLLTRPEGVERLPRKVD